MQIQASYKQIMELAAPIIVGSLAQNLIGITDVIFLGRVGEVELGACGLISIYYLVLMMIGFGISRAGQILIARRAGAGRNEEVGVITWNLFYLEMFVAFLLFLFLILLSPNVLWLFIKSQEIYDASLSYLSYRSYGIFFSLFGFVLMALYTGIGRTNIIAAVTTVLMISNVFLNYSLIFGQFGLPEMGIAGAGLASTLAEIISTVFGIGYLIYDRSLSKYNLRRFHGFDMSSMRRLVELSAPMVLQYLIGLGGWFILFALIENMGKRALSVSTVLKNVYTFLSIPAWGFASAANAIVSNLIGQGKYRRVMIAVNRTAVLSFIFTILPCLLLLLFPGTILPLFSSEAGVVSGTQALIPLLIAILLACSISVIIFNGMMGTGATTLSMFVQATAVAVYLTYAYSVTKVLNLDLQYVWTSEFLYWVIQGTLAYLYLNFGRWKELEF